MACRESGQSRQHAPPAPKLKDRITPIMSFKSSSGDGEGRKDKGGGERLCVCESMWKDSMHVRMNVYVCMYVYVCDKVARERWCVWKWCVLFAGYLPWKKTGHLYCCLYFSAHGLGSQAEGQPWRAKKAYSIWSVSMFADLFCLFWKVWDFRVCSVLGFVYVWLLLRFCN